MVPRCAETSPERFGRPSPSFPAWTVAVALVLITLAMVLRVAWDPGLDAPPRVGQFLDPKFSLVDQNGNVFTNAAFAGKPRVLLFGYTSCPDVCPTSLSALAENINELGPAAKGLIFAFVTVDPERDTPDRLKSYLSAFSPRIVGLTGKPLSVRKMLDGYHIFRERQPSPDGSYSVNHTSTVFLISGDGRLQETVAADALGRSAALKKIKRLASR